ncbi:unnamed protein product [Laminaria digitata]
MPRTARLEAPAPRPRQPQSQPPTRSPSARPVLAPPPSAPPQPPPTSSPSARPPLPSPPTLSPPPSPTASCRSTGTPLLTPKVVLALESPSQSATRLAQLPLPRPSPLHQQRCRKEGVQDPPPRSNYCRDHGQQSRRSQREDGSERRPREIAAHYQALTARTVHVGKCPHRLCLPCYAALRVRAGANLRCPACRATVTIDETGRSALRHHNDEGMVKALWVTRRAMPSEGGGESSTIH